MSRVVIQYKMWKKIDKCLPVKIFIISQFISQKPIELLVLHVPYFESMQNI